MKSPGSASEDCICPRNSLCLCLLEGHNRRAHVDYRNNTETSDYRSTVSGTLLACSGDRSISMHGLTSHKVNFATFESCELHVRSGTLYFLAFG